MTTDHLVGRFRDKLEREETSYGLLTSERRRISACCVSPPNADVFPAVACVRRERQPEIRLRLQANGLQEWTKR